MPVLSRPSLVEEHAFPFECSRSYSVEENYNRLHWHCEMEICYICRGSGKYLINGIEYPFCEGDIFLISNDEIHMCYDDDNLIMQVVMFDPQFVHGGVGNLFDYEYLRPFLEPSDDFRNKLDRNNPVMPQLVYLLQEIEQEYDAQQRGYDLMIKSLLQQFFTLIIRYCMTEQNKIRRNAISLSAAEKVRTVISYIEEHFESNITLSSLASLCGISVPYLCSTFKCFTGRSPIDFLIKRRILEAKILLSSTDKRIISISEECGFGSLSSFNHLFKDLVGCSPREYRKN